MMKSFLAAAVLAIGAFPLQAAPSLDDVSRYFNTLSTLQTDFIQYNADGTTARGTLYLDRPGKMRMEYEEGSRGGLLLVSNGSVAIFDDRGRAQPEQYPLSMTPLGPILARNVDLKKADEVAGLDISGDQISVFAQDPKHPDRGVAKFTLSGTPLRLENWTMTNATGETTHIVLSAEEIFGQDLSSDLFSIPHETKNRRDWRGR